MKLVIFVSLIFAIMVAISSCGSSSSQPDKSISVVSISNQTSKLERNGQVVVKFNAPLSTTVSFTGNLASLAASAISTTDSTDDTLTISPTTEWKGGLKQGLSVTVSRKNGDSKTFTLGDYSVPFKYSAGVSATYVIGKANLTDNSNGLTASDTGGIWDMLYNNNILYLVDSDNHRIMGYNSLPTASNAAADFVLGQTNFTSASASATQSTLNTPTAIDGNGTTFALVDNQNYRVLLYNNYPTKITDLPDLVLGQPDFNTVNSSGCSATALRGPYDVKVLSNKLLVADYLNHRVLIWNSIPTSNQQAADVVLGQTNLNTCARNDDNGDGTPDANPTARTMNNPSGVWSDGTTIIVSDGANNRVLIWNSFPTANFQPADIVLGQSSFTTATSGLTSSKFDSAEGKIGANDTQLCLADYNNHRVLIWNNRTSLTSGQAADYVVGQSNFTSNNNTPANNTLRPVGCGFVDNKLIVSEYNGYRATVYESE